MLKKIIVTPAGRYRFLRILYEHLKQAYKKKQFDEWHLWVNTRNISDLRYLNTISANNDWIKKIDILDFSDSSKKIGGPHQIHEFFKFACDSKCVYLRFDDDIVFVDKNAIELIFNYRIKNRDPFLVYANIINNAVISHLHYRNGLFYYPNPPGYSCGCSTGWNDPRFAEKIHRAFLKDLNDGNIEKWKTSFNTWRLYSFECVSINCVSWLGSTFHEFSGEVGMPEEPWLIQKTKELNKPNVILGEAIVAHFSFYVQREYLEEKTNILKQYFDISIDKKPIKIKMI